MKNTLDGINRRLDTSGGKINELEDTAMETIQYVTGEKDFTQMEHRYNVTTSDGLTYKSLES